MSVVAKGSCGVCLHEEVCFGETTDVEARVFLVCPACSAASLEPSEPSPDDDDLLDLGPMVWEIAPQGWRLTTLARAQGSTLRNLIRGPTSHDYREILRNLPAYVDAG